MPRLTCSRPQRQLAVLVAVVWAPFAACGDEDVSPSNGVEACAAGATGPGESGAPAAELPYAPCPEGEGVGQFEIAIDDEFTSVIGKVSDGVVPAPAPLELARAGDCRLLRTVQTRCDPGCPVATTVCGRDSVCVPLPRTHDVGTVTVHGLALPMQMCANAVTLKYSNPARPPLPYPGFLPGADLRVTTAGGDYAPFELRGWGITPLVLGSEPIEVAQGQPTALHWQVVEVPGPTRLDVELNINHHGSTGAGIKCDFADSGAGEIPAALIDGLIAEGFSGFPSLTATRVSATSAQIEPGCVDLRVMSQIEVSVQLQGVTSCNRQMPCPAGQTCLSVELFCQ
jgi:hypothetical protein